MTREEMEHEYKQVISMMQDQIQQKINEIQKFREQIETLNKIISDLKGEVANEKMRSEDEKMNKELYQQELRKRDDAMLMKEQNMQSLMKEIQKIKSTSENEIKKLKK